jgi:hypothetical protein
MTPDAVEFDRLPPEPERRIWCEWLRAHGVDPCDVAVPGWIERREAARQLVWLSQEGAAAHGVDVCGNRVGWPTCILRVLQLESPPLPWPTLP